MIMKADKHHLFNIGYYRSITKEFVKDYSSEGLIYKDYDAFNLKSIKVCYIPEQSEEHYTYSDFLSIADGDKDLAIYLFEIVDWQHPESLLDELER